ncbi:hypothetical protein [Baaleninema sp.]|uniref:hypothetical protein n=1 Tax=Baaleninema sp. TaxID=3101197 RepID=UPI003CFD74F3
MVSPLLDRLSLERLSLERCHAIAKLPVAALSVTSLRGASPWIAVVYQKFFIKKI